MCGGGGHDLTEMSPVDESHEGHGLFEVMSVNIHAEDIMKYETTASWIHN